jgi:hypothetical protein
LSRDAYRFAQRRNITTIAQEYLVKTKLTSELLTEHIYSLPDLTGQGAGNLDILFGIASPEAATLPAFSAEDGAQSVRFINALIQQAYGIYEFVVFDIGTAVTIPLHYAVLKASGHVLLIVNRWSPRALIKRDELPDYFGIPVFATIPLVESDMMMGLINQGKFISHAVWEDPEQYAALKPFVAGIAALSENFALGIVDILKKRMQAPKKRRAFFRR